MISFFIPMTPVPKGRPRFTVINNKPHKVYTPKATKSAENQIKLLVRNEMNKNRRKPYEIPITAYMVFQSDFASESTRHGPDIDNLVKLVLDALNGIVYTDDKLIYAIRAEKVYSEVPGIRCTFDEYQPTHNALGLGDKVTMLAQEAGG